MMNKDKYPELAQHVLQAVKETPFFLYNFKDAGTCPGYFQGIYYVHLHSSAIFLDWPDFEVVTMEEDYWFTNASLDLIEPAASILVGEQSLNIGVNNINHKMAAGVPINSGQQDVSSDAGNIFPLLAIRTTEGCFASYTDEV
jgi:hypothetical protein